MVDYPIDFVLPWVRQTDLNWARTYKRISEKLGRPVNLNSQRFRSWDNLNYIFRGIEKFMPWIRNVYLIVCAPSQLEPWMNTDTIHIVYHKDIIPKCFRPTFNSCTIEMFLKNIPDLSEHFIYSNDDLFVTKPMQPEDFFTKGLPNIHYRKVRYSDEQNMFRHQCKAGLDMISKDFNIYCKDFIFKNTHSVSPMLKSTMEKVWDLHKDEIYASISKFREEKNVNQYIYTYYQYFSDQFCDKMWSNMYTCFADYSLKEICKIIENQVTGMLCINDSGKRIVFKVFKEKLKQAFNKILPDKSKYEI